MLVGKGDRRTRRGKIYAGSFGKLRPKKDAAAPKKKKASSSSAKPAAKAAAKPAAKRAPAKS
jgi:30S ribosomal protein S31